MALISRARGGGHRVAALTAAFAILVQAVLFGWHHHAIPLRPQAALAVAILAAPTSPVMPAEDDHDCQICFTLGHHGAVPVGFFAAMGTEPIFYGMAGEFGAYLLPRDALTGSLPMR